MRDIFYGAILLVLLFVIMEPEQFGAWLQKVDMVRYTMHDLDLNTDLEP
jgi:hypothetical protein